MGQDAGVKHDLLSLVRQCQLIGDNDKQMLECQAVSCPEISVQRLLVDGGYVTESHLTSLVIGQKLIEREVVKDTQFTVAMFDEITTGITAVESLKVRGWLPPEWTPAQL